MMNKFTRRAFVRGGLAAGIGIGIAPEWLALRRAFAAA
jgi:hypothetical protein